MVVPGDEVMVAEPAYVSYRPLIQLAGDIPGAVPLRPRRGFRLDARDVAARISNPHHSAYFMQSQ